MCRPQTRLGFTATEYYLRFVILKSPKSLFASVPSHSADHMDLSEPAQALHRQNIGEPMSDSECIDLKRGEFFGTITRAAESASVRLSGTAYGPRVDVPYHVHQGAYFCFVVAGHFREMLNRCTLISLDGRGDAALISNSTADGVTQLEAPAC
jgi:hypothetical protein